MCIRNHWYIVERPDATPLYAGSQCDAAVTAVLAVGEDDEAYVVAEHLGDHTYCSAESDAVECAALAIEFADA